MSRDVPPLSPLTRQVMDMARRYLGMDVAFIAQVADGKQTYRALEGAAESFGLWRGGYDLLHDTFCNLMLQDKIPNVIPDASADDRVSALGMTDRAGIGSYVGIPLRHSDGSLYGTFCCLSHKPKTSLQDRDSAWMSMLSELLAGDLHEQRELDIQHERISRIIEEQRVTTALQPIVDLSSGRCIGVEALSRFDLGPPDEVFQQAEKIGLGVNLEHLSLWTAADLLPLLAPDQYLAINLSPSAGIDVADKVADMPELCLDKIVWEMTEHAAVRDYQALREHLDPLRERGLRVAIDDAGAGFASLHHIVELQPDIIKIDRSLVDGLAANRAQRSIVTGFVLLALDCDASLIAEGVETADDLEVVTSLGVEAAQGYLLARPSADREELKRWQAGDLLPRTRWAITRNAGFR